MKHHDPITGDELTNAEYISWHIQAVVRSPWFIIGFNLITLVMLTVGWRDWWNYFASYLAIMVEWVVGKYMFGQTGRDAKIIREIRTLTQRIEQQEETLVSDVEALEQDRSSYPSP